MEVLILLAVLFGALALIVPLIERSKMRISNEDAAKWAKWIWPLMGILLIAQLLRLMFS
ncbi:hypothetical protein AMBLS11_06790 [Alteromonas macleodii str. 'Black Sea 11']|jgi:hypothetical protein|uniref:hypothetical protein n=1 Tax=Alteromonas TaxID=226 RepID=UPI000286F589|nr:hypothetical protein [Alteromonas abrolhosensis]AFT77944.1 hypothetical protein AMBLS11_06790 [Alteromonas macleodii str. 'Black Sea 11']NKW89063.1 hypothetical protein [Alteromonadaceae bacterium A_SAG4]NKX18477.1 hypothetical protein [Alteromonadaceae bacterium A_SAG5]NKX35534.1 hypothetical protein [Alteromonadaceae bacterium A_SAG3]NKX69175.1 hypothetical protein [Alteromonadaceae bacterium A_SAG7]|tara:strand:+ start:1528 stop:1704 length:177 start_codon:yes stop_codon:yes gene_type:complete